MEPPTYHVEITVWMPELARMQESNGFAAYIVWYRNAQGSNSYHTGGSFHTARFHSGPPAKTLDYVLSTTTNFVRENWFLVEVSPFLRATRTTTAEAVTKRLTA